MNYCTNCGAEIKQQSNKFCAECGAKLSNEEKIEARIAENNSIPGTTANNYENKKELGSIKLNAHYLGSKFEDAIENILKADGYLTQRNQRLSNKDGLKSEIDILAFRKTQGNEEQIAVECKNYNSNVSVDKIRDFKSKLESLEIKNGLFVTYKDISYEALKWANSYKLEIWNGETVKEKIYELQVGRLGEGKTNKLEYSLPIKINYQSATKIDFDYKNQINVSNAKLIVRPFYKLNYAIHCVRNDPAKNKHVIDDSGYYIIDALTGEILKSKDTLQNIFKNITNGFSNKSIEEIKQEKENDIFCKELEQNVIENYSLEHSSDFNIYKLPPQIRENEAEKMIIPKVIKQYTKSVEYKLAKDEDDIFADTKDYVIKPTAKEIQIKNKLVYVAKWDLEFESKGYKYVKTISANSGKTITDTLKYCGENHWLDGFIDAKNIGVCDVCGKALCKEHVHKCAICGSWRCNKHSQKCMICNKYFCEEHTLNKCSECNEIICNDCTFKCPICNELHCSKHMTKCQKCGKTVCISCTRKEGNLLFKKTICKSC
jgi:Restriction endonuclease/zinc-ribbon domain